MEAKASKVKIGGKKPVVVGDKSSKCNLPACPKAAGGEGEVTVGSQKVKIEGKFAARVLDTTKHAQCVGPVPAPVGKIMGPGATTVMIG